jgi:hypothetical protein
MEVDRRRSGIFVVGVAIKEIRDDLQHGLEEAYFVASLASEEAEVLSLQGLLLLTTMVLPCRIRLEPVSGVWNRKGKLR